MAQINKIGVSHRQFELLQTATMAEDLDGSGLWAFRRRLHGDNPKPPPLDVVVLEKGQVCPADTVDYRNADER